MKGDDVKQLQESLNKMGYSCGTPDGKFGLNTRSAVKKFQKDNGLDNDGIVGAKTWAKIDELENKKEEKPKKEESVIPENPSTLQIQKRLIEWGFGPVCGKADGILGSKTKEAIKQFQTSMSIKPSGKVDEKTKKALWGDIIVPRISDDTLKCQCTASGKNYCDGYPQGKGYGIGVRILAERIFREVDKTFPKTKYYITTVKTPQPGNATAGGYRCSKWNKEKGGASGSQHKYCKAMDIYGKCDGVANSVIRKYIEDVAMEMNTYGGVGYGAYYIVHIDIRGNKARWKY
jgi:hypothetical protein